MTARSRLPLRCATCNGVSPSGVAASMSAPLRSSSCTTSAAAAAGAAGGGALAADRADCAEPEEPASPAETEVAAVAAAGPTVALPPIPFPAIAARAAAAGPELLGIALHTGGLSGASAACCSAKLAVLLEPAELEAARAGMLTPAEEALRLLALPLEALLSSRRPQMMCSAVSPDALGALTDAPAASNASSTPNWRARAAACRAPSPLAASMGAVADAPCRSMSLIADTEAASPRRAAARRAASEPRAAAACSSYSRIGSARPQAPHLRMFRTQCRRCIEREAVDTSRPLQHEHGGSRSRCRREHSKAFVCRRAVARPLNPHAVRLRTNCHRRYRSLLLAGHLQ